MRIALTGASGYTGGHVLSALVARGEEVVALVRTEAGASALREKGAQTVVGDLAQSEAAERLVSGCQAVVHIAAVYRTAGHPDEYYREINVRGSERLLDAATRHGVKRFVHTSTVGVHGDVQVVPSDETGLIAPGDIYQKTKAEAEAIALGYAQQRGLPVAVVRPGAIYGPREQRFLKLFRAIARGHYAIVGTGKPFYHPVFIDDLVSGFLLALDRPEAVGETFIIAGPEYVSQAELAALIAKHTNGKVLPFKIPAWPIQLAGSVCEALLVPFGIEPPVHRRRADFWTKSRAFSTAKAERLLGYKPRVGLDEGIARTAASYREAGWL